MKDPLACSSIFYDLAGPSFGTTFRCLATRPESTAI